MTIILDASAALSVLLQEPGADEVEAHLDEAVIGAVNLAEIVSALIRTGNSIVQARALLAALNCRSHAADYELALDAGSLRPLTDRVGLSLGDRFCLALGRRLNAPVLTADRVWASVAMACEVDVRLIR